MNSLQPEMEITEDKNQKRNKSTNNKRSNSKLLRSQENEEILKNESQDFESQDPNVLKKDKKNLEEINYDYTISLSNLFTEQPKIENFFNFQCKESRENVTVSLLSYAKGSSYLLSQIIDKNISKQRDEKNDLFMYNYEKDKYKNFIFINSKRMGQPTCYQTNINEYQKQKFQIDILSEISDIMIFVVNEVTQQEQELIQELKIRFLLKKKMDDRYRELIIVHNLFQTSKEDLQQYPDKIQKYFKLDQQEESNNKYFIDQEYKNITHFIIGNENSQEKKKYLTKQIKYIKGLIFKSKIDGYSIHKKIQDFLNNYYELYAKIEKKEVEKGEEEEEEEQKEEQNQSQLFDDVEQQKKESIKPLVKNERPSEQIKINNQSNNFEKENQVQQCFIQKNNDLALNNQFYQFKEVKNFNYQLQKKVIKELNYRLFFSQGNQLQVLVEIPGLIKDIKLSLTTNDNSLIISFEKQMYNSQNYEPIQVRLQNHLFKIFKLLKKDSYENSNGILKIYLKKSGKYDEELSSCFQEKNFKIYCQLDQIEYNN